MDSQLLIIIALTFVIHLIGTLAYAFRIAGVRTGYLAIAFSLFNILILISRLSNALQGPFLAKRVEGAIASASIGNLPRDFALILLASSAGTIMGGLMLPTFQRLATAAVAHFQRQRSMLRLISGSLSPRGASVVLRSTALPRYTTLANLLQLRGLPTGVLVLNFVATALWTVGVLSSIYAGVLVPELRVTAATLSSLINGLATVMMFVMVDPFLSAMTDDAAKGTITEGHLRRFIYWMVMSRFVGTLAAQVILQPGAALIAWFAKAI